MTDPRNPAAPAPTPSGWLNSGSSTPVPAVPAAQLQMPSPAPAATVAPQPYHQASPAPAQHLPIPAQAAPLVAQQPYAAEALTNPAVQAEAQPRLYSTHAGQPVVPAAAPAPATAQAVQPAPANAWLSGPGPSPFAAQLAPETESASEDDFADYFEGNQFTELPEQAIAPAFESTVAPVGDEDVFSALTSRPHTDREPKTIGPDWLRKAPYAGIALSVAGVAVAFIPAVHAFGFWLAMIGVVASATGFLPPRKLRLTAIALLVSLVATFATGLVHTGSKPTPAAPAGGPNSVTFTVQGVSESTDAALQYTVDRADTATALRVNGGNLPWTKTVAVNAKSGSAQDVYTVRATPDSKAKTGLACYITVGDTIVAMGLARPGEQLVCRYTGTVDHPTAVGTMKDTKNLIDSLKAQPAAG